MTPVSTNGGFHGAIPSHFRQLMKMVPDLPSKLILDVGCGAGSFLVNAAQFGAEAVGVEIDQEYIEKAYQRARVANVEIAVIRAPAEDLPFSDETFDFVNVSEVFEHVENQYRMVMEIVRVLKPSGQAYISIPNRHGFKDQHFGLYFVNWLPRSWSDKFISVFGTHKNYADKSAGLQRLADMHYTTYSEAVALFELRGFKVQDIRAGRLPDWLYVPLRTFYFDSFHFLITKL